MTSGASYAELRAAIEETIQHATFLLDERQFGAWLQTTAQEFSYRIVAYSPELRKDMVWLEHGREDVAALIELLPKHHVNGADWLRQVVVGSVSVDSALGVGATQSVKVVSSLSIFHTARDVGDSHIDGGSSQLFAVGRYHDRYQRSGDNWLLAERSVRLQTRQLGVGSHLIP